MNLSVTARGRIYNDSDRERFSLEEENIFADWRRRIKDRDTFAKRSLRVLPLGAFFFQTMRHKKESKRPLGRRASKLSKLAEWCVASCSIHNREKLPCLFPREYDHALAASSYVNLRDHIVIYHVPAVIYRLLRRRWSTRLHCNLSHTFFYFL